MKIVFLFFFFLIALLPACSTDGKSDTPDGDSYLEKSDDSNVDQGDNLPDNSNNDDIEDSVVNDKENYTDGTNEEDIVPDDETPDNQTSDDDIVSNGELPSINKTVYLGTEKDDFPTAINIASNGDILAVLYTQGAFEGTNAGAIDLVVARYDSDLNPKWIKQYGSDGYDSPYDIDESSDGSIYVTGTTSGPLNGITIKGYHDIFVMKLDSQGEHLWTKSYGTESREVEAKMVITPDGKQYISATTDGALNGESTNGYLHAAVFKIDSEGIVEWTKLIGTGEGDRGNHLVIGETGDLYLAGQTYGTFPGNTAGGDTCTTPPCTDAYLAKLSSDGTVNWIKQWGTSENDSAWDVAVDKNGIAYLSGSVMFESFPGFTNAGISDIFIVKVNPDGSQNALSQWGSTDEESSTATAFWKDSAIFLGQSKGDMYGNSNKSSGSPDIFLTILDSEGMPDQMEYIGSDMWDQPTAIITTGDSVYITGYTYGSIEGLATKGYADAFIIKLK
jgi:hypothetical protein